MYAIESETLPARMRGAVSLAWSLFARKVGGGIIEINKEASMQLHFGYILQQFLPLITFRQGEEPKLEWNLAFASMPLTVKLTSGY